MFAAHEVECEIDDDVGVVGHGLDLVSGGPLERAEQGSRGEVVEQWSDAVDVSPAASLVDGQYEHDARL
ncbi:hypothetical protein RE9431_23090 [Prescottella equi]|nr:hypothetical protein RE9416_23000 [Prescottella equi]BCN54020.1 hypothetical protein RE9425_24100 [Prescottella equi]BCN58972.1 hypothetical protein RE9427_23420 [Prescottella equi]BCN63854.1 hypothetical protein RE9431_23090 [Prescottella equi]BCN73705.1 hypothetical protein RE0327_23040 [Prescottella equi]